MGESGDPSMHVDLHLYFSCLDTVDSIVCLVSIPKISSF